MNRVLLANHFQVETPVDLLLYTRTETKDGKRRLGAEPEYTTREVGTVHVLLNLQNEDQEEEARRNFALRMQELEEKAAQQEAERIEMSKKRLQYNMEQAATFGQLYIHVEKLGSVENTGSTEQADSLNARASGATGTDELVKLSNEAAPTGIMQDDDLARAEPLQGASSITQPARATRVAFPKRNLFVRFKAFPNLE
jgi:hypothetical protein